jgi:TonB-linked SusC/RagA family outer membrane protein
MYHPQAWCLRTTLKRKYMKNFNDHHFPPGKWKRILFFMNLKLVLLLCSVGVLAAAPSYSQQKTLDVSYRGEPLVRVLDDLKTKTGYRFVYFKDVVPQRATVTVSRSGATMEQVLDEVLSDNGLTYSIMDDMVIISRSEGAARQQPAQAPATVRGTVRNPDGTPVAGASVMIRGTQTGTTTGADGAFSLVVPQVRDGAVLTVSYVGKRTVEVTWRGQQSVDITLEDTAESIEQVVVTGMFERRKESFTGAEQTFTRDDLRRVGNSNVLQSIANLDPSFRFEENLVDGSNPNSMPEIRLRGQSGFPNMSGTYSSDPNSPYFIVDGFESSLAAVMDMDMNRIASVTLLKDAAAKAIYGSKAANGVVVIETVKPAAGQLRVSYNGSLNMQIPDLKSYNLANAAEKLQIEKDGGIYEYRLDTGLEQLEDADAQFGYDNSYYGVQNEVRRGVDTDWLAQPTRVGVGQKHSLFLEGGDQSFQYGVNVSYNNVAGVMKKSNRNTFAGGVVLSYRYKSVTFRNNLTVTYNKGVESPYGSFSEYAHMNPYLRIYDDRGNVAPRPTRLIPGYVLSDASDPRYNTSRNPMYNASLNSKNFADYTEIKDNFNAEWTPAEGLKFTARASLIKTTSGSDLFVPARNTEFLDYTDDEELRRRGRYTVTDGEAIDVSGDVGANYSRTLGERHFLFANLTWAISDRRSNSHGMTGVGFPDNDLLDDFAFASQYEPDSSPSSGEATVRDMGVVGALNYSYDDRYLFDASMRMGGSSLFSANRRWGLFWSLGTGWNLHHEKFMEQVGWIDRLKLRGSLGYTGSQEFKPYQMLATFQYFADDFYDGQGGAYLISMANPWLKWQRKFEKNIGMDMTLLDNRLSARLDYYVTDTKDLVTMVTTPSSTGFKGYAANLGDARNTGYEASVRYRVWNDTERRSFLNVFASVSHNKSEIKKVSNSLTTFNQSQVDKVNNSDPTIPATEKNGYLIQYVEGHSLNGIWAVPSAGIDPATGRELYITRDGGRTFTWNARDLRECGVMEPKLSGNTGFNLEYKGFGLNVTGTWRFGGQIYNNTLADKVENADIRFNVDRRIFTDRWTRPGDHARFKDIRNDDPTKATSRFVEDDDVFTISSVNAFYDLSHTRFVRACGMERLRVLFDMSDIARLSTVALERGTAYPFAYAFSFSLQATF